MSEEKIDHPSSRFGIGKAMSPMTSESSPLLPPGGGHLVNGGPAAAAKIAEADAEDPSSPAPGPGGGLMGESADGARDIVESPESWLRLILFFAAAAVSGGVIPGQNIYNRMFCEAGLFAYACRDETGGDAGGDAGGDDGDDVCCSAQWLLL